MTAALDRVCDALTARPATVFFDALIAADGHIDEHAHLARTASLAPPVHTFASCVCGSTFEIRGGQIEATADEMSAAGDAIADKFGRPTLSELDRQIVARVIDAINHERAVADGEALRDWEDNHADCGGDW